ncbi:hypothetical protein AGLY_005144 [Aphis glycines]|uniref:Uncharacterized protein n=1 Tax=Aphis glycines TaxID=307491 RepID=A0A6G0TVY5_APHGL|nr:hypothetical protein AGLY_005144 [Aphis glycines]
MVLCVCICSPFNRRDEFTCPCGARVIILIIIIIVVILLSSSSSCSLVRDLFNERSNSLFFDDTFSIFPFWCLCVYVCVCARACAVSVRDGCVCDRARGCPPSPSTVFKNFYKIIIIVFSRVFAYRRDDLHRIKPSKTVIRRVRALRRRRSRFALSRFTTAATSDNGIYHQRYYITNETLAL